MSLLLESKANNELPKKLYTVYCILKNNLSKPWIFDRNDIAHGDSPRVQ